MWIHACIGYIRKGWNTSGLNAQSRKNGNEVYDIGCLGKVNDFHRKEQQIP